MNLGTNEKVKIYYNKVTLGERNGNPHIVHLNCQHVELPWRQATEYAEVKMSRKEWTVYLIPALNSLEVVYEDNDTTKEENVRQIECKCGNKEELLDNDTLPDNFIFGGKDQMFEYYVCSECLEETKIELPC